MKYVIVTIRREPGIPMKYPAKYDSKEVDANKKGPLVYSGNLGKGEASEEMMLFLNDIIADDYATGADMKIVNEAQADAWLAANERIQERAEEVVTDPDRMLAIIAKALNVIAPNLNHLSAEDVAALDPDNKMRGINRKPKTAAGIFG